MVLPICQRVTYCTLVAPWIAVIAPSGCLRSVTCIVTLRVEPLGEKLSWLERMSMPGWLLPSITAYRASPAGSLRPLTGELDGPLTLVPNRPRPDDWRA